MNCLSLRFLSVFTLICLLSASAADRAQAELIIRVDSPAPVFAGSTGNTVDVLLDVTSVMSPALELDAFNVTLSFNSAPVTITNVLDSGMAPFVFSDSLGLLFNLDPTIPTPSVDFNDLGLTPTVLDQTGSFLLGRVVFDVAAGATPGDFDLTVIDPTSLSAPGGVALDFSTEGSTLSVVVPEPSTAILAAMGACGLATGVIVRRRCAG